MSNKVPKYKLKPEAKNLDKEVISKTETGRKVAEGLFGSIYLITFGIIFLLNNFGVLPWSVWGTLLRFWPVILILTGIQIVLGRSLVAQIIFGFLMIIVIVFVVLLSVSPSYPNIGDWFSNTLNINFNAITTVTEGNKISEELQVMFERELQEVSERELNVVIGSSSFIVKDNKELDNHLTVNADYYEGFNVPKLTTEILRGKLFIDFETESESRFWFQGMGKTSFDFTLGQTDIPTSVNVDLGSGNGEIDFDELNLKDFKIDIGSGSIDLSLSGNAVPTKNAIIDLGSGSVKAGLPENVGVKVNYDIGSGSLTIDSARLRGSGTYNSKNYDTAEKTFEMEVKVGSGKVEFFEM